MKLKKNPPIHATLTGFDSTRDPALPRSKAIRAKCLECCCDNRAEVRRCHIVDCPLWPWRLGRRLRAGDPGFSGVPDTNGTEVDPDPDRDGG